MRCWFRVLVVPCSLLMFGFAGCGDNSKSKGNNGDGSGGTSTSMGGSSSNGSGGNATSSGGSSATGSGGSTGGSSNSGGNGGTGGNLSEQTGSSCETADDCYPQLTDDELAGQAMCLDRVEGGYCTHECEEDTDCCAVEGECDDTFSQVCGPFENTGLRLCFLSCEADDIASANEDMTADEFCQANAGNDFICRSTGGGSQNRRVCVPGVSNGEGGAAGAAGQGGQSG